MRRSKGFTPTTEDQQKARAGDCACEGYYRQPLSPRGGILMASTSVPRMYGWGNLYSRCQAPLDCLRTMEEVCGRFFCWVIGSWNARHVDDACVRLLECGV